MIITKTFLQSLNRAIDEMDNRTVSIKNEKSEHEEINLVLQTYIEENYQAIAVLKDFVKLVE